jgi:hypothetical protein
VESLRALLQSGVPLVAYQIPAGRHLTKRAGHLREITGHLRETTINLREMTCIFGKD